MLLNRKLSVQGSLHEEEALDVSSAAECCVPGRCLHSGQCVDLPNANEAVKLQCSNESCPESGWMHADCFKDWEQKIVEQVRTKKGQWKQGAGSMWKNGTYEQVASFCGCKCGGTLRKEGSGAGGGARRRKASLKSGQAAAGGRKGQPGGKQRSYSHSSGGVLKIAIPADPPSLVRSLHVPNPRAAVDSRRQRTTSLNSHGSASPESNSDWSGSPHSVPDASTLLQAAARKRSFSESQRLFTGSIFAKRTDLGAFATLPKSRRNAVYIKIDDDDGPFGNDDTRSFVLSRLSMVGQNYVKCVLCDRQLQVYDRYPLVDGTFYLSAAREEFSVPVRAQETSPGRHFPRDFWLSAVCMHCLNWGCDVRCKACKARWDGANLVLGSMYSYDVFAAQPCCEQRLKCKACNLTLDSPEISGHRFYSSFSRPLTCYHCLSEDFHFVRPVGQIFDIHVSTWSPTF